MEAGWVRSVLNELNGVMELIRDGRGSGSVRPPTSTGSLVRRPTAGRSPLRSQRGYQGYATFHPGVVEVDAHERAIVDLLSGHTSDQPWSLGCLDADAHDMVFPQTRKRSFLYAASPYVLIEAPPDPALSRGDSDACARTAHCRICAFRRTASSLVSALWDDLWTDVGGFDRVDHRPERESPIINATQVRPNYYAVAAGADAPVAGAITVREMMIRRRAT